jgi:cytochrome P450
MSSEQALILTIEKISASVFDESLKQTDGMLDELFGTDSQAGDCAVTTKAFDMMKKITIHVLSGAGMGVSPSWRETDNEKPKAGFKMTYIQAVKVVIDAMAGPMVLPVIVLNNWPAVLPGAAFLRKLGLAIGQFTNHMNDMLEKQKSHENVNQGQKANILTQLVAASEAADEGSKANFKHGSLTQSEMRGNLFLFTAAGFDTTANTLSYALATVARYPQW